MKGKIKANTVDKYLHPIRLQIVERIKPNSTVLEFGCGDGDLLFKLSNKIKTGFGIDNSKQLIAYAKERIEKEQVKNLEFKLFDLIKDTYAETDKDYCILLFLDPLFSICN